METDGSLTQQSIGNLAVNNLAHHGSNGLLGMLFQAFGRSLTGVGHHQYGGLLGLRIRSRIGEWGLVHLLVGTGFASLIIEIAGDALAMMLGNQVLDNLGQIGVFGNLQAIGDMVNDNLGAVLGSHEVVMRILANLILGKESRIFGLANIVVERTGPHQLHVGTDFQRRLTAQVGHHERVLEGTRAVAGQLTQQRVVDVAQLEQGHRRSEAKDFLDNGYNQEGREEDDDVKQEIPEVIVVNLPEVTLGNQGHRHINDAVGKENKQGTAHQLGALGQVLDRDDGNNASDELHDDELSLLAAGNERADEHRDNVYKE